MAPARLSIISACRVATEMDQLFERLKTPSDSKIVLMVLDGLGGFRTPQRGSELFEAKTPNLDRLAKEGSSGVHTVVAPGVTPGSGAGHLALFGYDPLKWELGRGALSAAGIGFDLQSGDVAARVNFCHLDDEGMVTDRRAGRLPTEENERLCLKIREKMDLGGVEFFLQTEKEHRALLVLRGEGLSPLITDTDPQAIGVSPLAPAPIDDSAERTAACVRDFLDQAKRVLQGEKANFLLLRGFDTLPDLPSFNQRYGLNGIGIASYPMYRGIARIAGMQVPSSAAGLDGTLQALRESWPSYDFMFVHHKATDSAGEDGDFDRKVAAIEEVDAMMPEVMKLQPDVICVTGDHSTPSQMMEHSWHQVAFVMWGSRIPTDSVETFNEEAARLGGFGSVMAKDLMPHMLAAAGRLMKFGA